MPVSKIYNNFRYKKGYQHPILIKYPINLINSRLKPIYHLDLKQKEISKSHRFFFYDNGIRNALIGNFNPLEIRNDVGQLWENYIIAERLKSQEYMLQTTNSYYWRTYDKKEIDLVEERQGKLFGYEIKWTKGRAKAPNGWHENYPDAAFEIISKDNYLQFIQ